MLRYFLVRLLLMIPTLLGISLVVFLIMHLFIGEAVRDAFDPRVFSRLR